MKLSKLVSISVTATATTIYLFGVMVVGVLAQDMSVNVVNTGEVLVSEEDLSLVEPEVKSGFGLVVRRWWWDLRERLSNDPDEVLDNAERELALIEDEVAEGEGFSPEQMEKARQRYEAKLAKLEEMMNGLGETKREILLQRIAKHEAVLSKLYVYEAADESSAGVQAALARLEAWKEKALERFGEKQDRVEARLEARRAAIEAKLAERKEKFEGRLEARREKIEERKAHLEEIRAERQEKLEQVKEKQEAMKQSLEERKEARKSAIEAHEEGVKEAAELKKAEFEAAQERFKERLEERKKLREQEEKVEEYEAEKMEDKDYQVVKGLIDYQPSGFWERLGWWLGGL